MSDLTYDHQAVKPVFWLKGKVRTPPFSTVARIEAGMLLRRLQRGEKLSLPHSRPLPSIGPACHELRVRDADRNWRIVYCIDAEAIAVLDVFAKTTRKMPLRVIEACRQRLAEFRSTP
jgi:phage-related protein